jgi:outer membrane protein OmpA-like peptidoglycan-associated protein
MKNMKKLILSGLLFLGVLSAQAQAQQQGTTEYDFNPHWYVQIQPLGLQHTLGELDFGDLNHYNIQAAVGYNFNKVLGARLSVNGWSSKAGIELKQADLRGYDFKKEWKWNYIAPSLELTANLSNAFFGVNPKRLFTLSAFIGVGANIAWDNKEAQEASAAISDYLKSVKADENLEYLWDGTKTRFTGRGGLMGDFRISDRFSVGLEVNANILNDKYNSKKAGNADWYFNALAGVKINLGNTYNTRVIPPVEPEIRYVDKIVEKIVEVPGKPAEVAKAAPLRRDIFFKINSTKIRPEEVQKVVDIANYLKDNRDARVVMTGHADKGTGNASINARLAAGRAKAVKDMLVNNYNIPESRITYESKGDTVQPFPDDTNIKENKNRVTICIAE